MHQAAYQSQQYRNQDVLNASPLRLVIMAYDLAINSCERKDIEKATKAISVLRDALNFDYPEVSVGLFRIYQWCLDCIRKEDYTSAIHTLTELRDAWKATEQQISAKPVVTTSIASTAIPA